LSEPGPRRRVWSSQIYFNCVTEYPDEAKSIDAQTEFFGAFGNPLLQCLPIHRER
jgi:hypothetical protein